MGNFDWKIWAEKGLKKILIGGTIGGLTELASYLGTEPVPTKYIWFTIMGVQIVELILNAIKHRKSMK